MLVLALEIACLEPQQYSYEHHNNQDDLDDPVRDRFFRFCRFLLVTRVPEAEAVDALLVGVAVVTRCLLARGADHTLDALVAAAASAELALGVANAGLVAVAGVSAPM